MVVLVPWVAGRALAVPVATWQQPVDESETVKQWVVELVTRLQRDPLPQGIEVEYTLAFPPTLTPSQLEQLRAEVTGKPDHPKRDRYENENRRATRGPDIAKARIAWWDLRLARVGQEQQWSSHGYADCAVSGEQMWVLTSTSLIAADGQTPHGKHVEYRYDKIVRAGAVQLSGLISGGLSGPFTLDPSTTVVKMTKRQYAVEIFSENRAEHMSALITWDGARGRVDRAALGNHTKIPELVMWTYEASEWSDVPGLGWMARKLKRTDADGEVWVLNLQSAHTIPKSDVLVATAVPENHLEDPWRGKLNLTQIDDFRADKRTRTVIDEASGVKNVQPVVFESRGDWLRWVGWVSGAVVASAVFGVWAYKRMSARSGVLRSGGFK